MKRLSTFISALVLLFLITGSLHAQIAKFLPKNFDAQKAVKVIDEKIVAYDFDLNAIDKSVKSVYVIKPDSVLKDQALVTKYGKNANFGIIFINTFSSNSEVIQNDEHKTEVFTFVERMPQFPGGDVEMLKFVQKNVRYPSDAIKNGVQGKVVARFVVNETGKVEKAEIVRSVDPSCDREALRIIKLLPKFIPGTQNGKNVSVWFTLPITFRQEGLDNTYKQKEEWTPTKKTIVVYNGKRMPTTFNLSQVDMAKAEIIALIKPESNVAKQKLINQYGKGADNGAIVINDKYFKIASDTMNSQIKIDDNNYVFVKLNKGAQFPGGEKLAMEFIKNNLVYPISARMNNIQGKVEIQFTIDKLGKVRNPRVIGNKSQLLSDAALDVIYKFPDWIPAEQDGIKVNSMYTLPFEFKIETPMDEKVYQVIEQMPEFPGGASALLKFIQQNIKHPKGSTEGVVIIRFVVSRLGKVGRVEVVRGIDPDYDSEALRVVSILPDFIPGKQNGIDVAVWYTIPVRFRNK